MINHVWERHPDDLWLAARAYNGMKDLEDLREQQKSKKGVVGNKRRRSTTTKNRKCMFVICVSFLYHSVFV